MTIAFEPLASTMVLLCRSMGRLCAFDLDHVRETMRALPVQPVPDMPSCVAGVAMIRGIAAPVLDVNCLLGGAAGKPARRFISLKLDARHLALAVDEVIGVRAIAADQLAGIAPLLQDADQGMVRAIATLDAELLLILQASRMMPEHSWQALAAAGSLA